MFEFYTDLDKLIAEFPRLIRDRKKIYKKRIIESICKEKYIYVSSDYLYRCSFYFNDCIDIMRSLDDIPSNSL